MELPSFDTVGRRSAIALVCISSWLTACTVSSPEPLETDGACSHGACGEKPSSAGAAASDPGHAPPDASPPGPSEDAAIPAPQDAAGAPIDPSAGAPPANADGGADAAQPTPAPAVFTPVVTGDVVEFPLSARALVADPVRPRLYVTVAASSAHHPGQLVVIDTRERRVVHGLPLGGDPGPMAISGDATTLWVGLGALGSIRRVDLTTDPPSPGVAHALPSGQAGWLTVLPGTSDSVAVAIHRPEVSRDRTGLIVLDEGVPRSLDPLNQTAGARLAAGPEGYLFGFGDASTLSFYTLAVTARGVVTRVASPSLVGGALTDLRYDAGERRVYATSGAVVDVSDPERPRRAGVFAYAGLVSPDPNSDLAWMLSIPAEGAAPVLRTLDASRFTQLRARSITEPDRSFEVVRELVHASDVAAFIACRHGEDQGNVLMVRSPEPRAPPGVPAGIEPIARGELIELPVEALALVADPVRPRLYASVGGGAQAYANSVLAIDAADGRVLQVWPVGSEPSALAIADDGSTLWLGLAGSFGIQALDLTAPRPMPGPAHPLPPRDGGRLGIARSLMVLPGTTHSVAAALALEATPAAAGVVVLDDGVARPTETSSETRVSTITTGPDGYLFGYGEETRRLYTLALDASGITTTAEVSWLVGGIGTEITHDRDGYLYATSGQVVDVRVPEAPLRAGEFMLGGSIWPHPGSDLALMVSPNGGASGPLLLQLLDTSARRSLATRTLGDPAQTLERASDLVYQSGVLAFRAGAADSATGHVFLLHDDALLALPEPEPAPPPPAPVPRGDLLELAIAAQAVVADPVRARFYAVDDQRLFTIDAVTAQVLHAVAIGYDPRSIAISDDGSTLWAGLAATQELRKIDLTTEFPSPSEAYVAPFVGSGGAKQPRNLIVLPGTTDAVVMTLHDAGLVAVHRGAAMIEDGRLRSSYVEWLGAAMLAPGPTGIVYGIDGFSTAYPGLFPIRMPEMALQPGSADMLLDYAVPSYDPDGYLYGRRGEVVDVRAPETPRRAGLFPYSGAVWPAPDSELALMITPGSFDPEPLELRLLDAGTFTQLATRTIGDPAQTFTDVRHLVHAGAHSLAFIAQRNRDAPRVYVLHDPDLLDVPAPEPPAVAPIARDRLIEIPLEAQSMVADPARQRLYAVVHASAQAYPNRLVTIDAQTGLVLHDVYVGSEPRWLALSEDASTLWVTLHGSHEIRRVDLTSGAPVPGEVFEVPRTASGVMPTMLDMALLGGTTESVAIIRRHADFVPHGAGLVVIDSGVGRPGQTSSYTDALSSGPPGYLFSTGGDAGSAFVVMALDADGVASQTTYRDLLSGISASITYDPDGFVYAASGDIVDVRDPAAPRSAGAFPFAGPVWPQPGGELALMITDIDSSSSAAAALRVLDASTLSEISALSLDDLPTAVRVRDLVHVPPSTVAFIAASNSHRSVYLLADFALP